MSVQTLSRLIVEALEGLPRDETEMLTLTSIKNLIGDKGSDDDLLQALECLCGEPEAVLDRDYLLIDEDGEEFLLTDYEILEARHDGELIHPEFGTPIVDFESMIIPVFRASERFSAARTAK